MQSVLRISSALLIMACAVSTVFSHQDREPAPADSRGSPIQNLIERRWTQACRVLHAGWDRFLDAGLRMQEFLPVPVSQEAPSETDEKRPPHRADELLDLMQKLAVSEQEKQQLSRKLQHMESENDYLRRRIQDLVKESMELKQTLKDLRARTPSSSSSPHSSLPASGDNNGASYEHPRPDRLIRGSILTKGTDSRFVIVNKGLVDGIKVGYRFKVVRDGKLISVIEVSKLLDTGYSKALVLPGYKFEDIRDFDEVEAITSGSDIAAVSPPPVVEIKPFAPDKTSSPPGKDPLAPYNYRIIGIAGSKYTLNIGKQTRLKSGDRVGVLRDFKVIAELVIEQVDLETSTARLSDQSEVKELREGDDIRVRTPESLVLAAGPSKISGVIKSVRQNPENKQLVQVLLDRGYDHGVASGQTFVVKRNNEMVGKLTVIQVSTVFSFATPSQETRVEDLHPGDTVELQ